MNPLFERLSLQGHLRRLIDQLGEREAWEIIRAAVERELQHTLLTRRDEQKTPH